MSDMENQIIENEEEELEDRDIDSEDVENSEEWEEVVSTGMEARAEKDKAQWILGDLAFKVYTNWGRYAVEKYAIEIGIQKTTLLRYMDVSRAIRPELRESYKNLSYSHFKVAAGTGEPEEWLRKASDENWSVELMGIEVKKSRGDQVPEEQKVKITECPKCHRKTLVGEADEICVSFQDCRDTAN